MNAAKVTVSEQIERLDEDALTRECAKLDPTEEQTFANLELSNDLTEWPAY